MKATGTNKNLAALYLERLKSGGGTNISDALEEAFILAGPGALDTTEALEVETIFLLSDGAPTIGKIRSRSGIIEKCGEWNSTLGIGPQFNCGI